MIPKILHRVVPEHRPAESERFWERFGELHPDWELVTWSDPLDPVDFELGDLFSQCRAGAQLADLVRLEVLWRHGGVYVDMDVEPVRPLDPLLQVPCFVGTEDGSVLTNAVMGAVPRHPGIRACIDRIRDEGLLELDVRVDEATGPGLVTGVLEGRGDVAVLPPEMFYPYYERRAESLRHLRSRHTYLVHHWYASWVERPRIALGKRPAADFHRWRGSARTRVLNGLIAAKQRWDALPLNRAVSHGCYLGNDRVVVATSFGFPLLAAAGDLRATPQLVNRGIADAELLRFVQRAIRPGDHVVDVGAGVGLGTVVMANACGRFGMVHASEPNPDQRALLADNLALNSLVGRVSLLDADSSKPLDARFPGPVPLRLVNIGRSASAADVLRGMRNLLDRELVSIVVLNPSRRGAGNSWPELIKGMRDLVCRGAHTLVPSSQRQARRVDFERVLARGDFEHVIFSFEELVDR